MSPYVPCPPAPPRRTRTLRRRCPPRRPRPSHDRRCRGQTAEGAGGARSGPAPLPAVAHAVGAGIALANDGGRTGVGSRGRGLPEQTRQRQRAGRVTWWQLSRCMHPMRTHAQGHKAEWRAACAVANARIQKGLLRAACASTSVRQVVPLARPAPGPVAPSSRTCHLPPPSVHRRPDTALPAHHHRSATPYNIATTWTISLARTMSKKAKTACLQTDWTAHDPMVRTIAQGCDWTDPLG